MIIKKLLAAVMAFVAASVFAASVDVNKASQAELETVKDVGPATATRILDERKKGEFKDWSDLMNRVSGIKEARAAKLSAVGLTVNGDGYGTKKASKAKPAAAKASEGAAPAAKGGKKEEKTAGRAEAAASKPAPKK